MALIYSCDKYVLDSFDVLGLLLGTTDIKMTKGDPFHLSQELRSDWEKQTNEWQL